MKLVDEKDIPWGDLAFPSTEFALRRYVEDRNGGRRPGTTWPRCRDVSRAPSGRAEWRPSKICYLKEARRWRSW